MERFESLLDFINELNESGRIQYDDYSRLFDLAEVNVRQILSRARKVIRETYKTIN